MTYRRGQSKPYSGPTKAAINRSKMTGWVDVVTPYLPDFVDELKSSIQPSHRQWDPAHKVWHVNELFLNELIPMLKRYFDEVTTDLLDSEETSDNAFKAIFDILKKMPNGNIDKIYQQLAFALHPDRGGSNEQMRLLNEAYEKVKK